MKNILYILLLTTQVFFAQNGFEKECFVKRENTSKLLTHGSVLKTNQHSSELYFNLGNCYYKLNKVAPAIYSYEKVSAESK
jgi:hypothetical protein